MHLLKLPKQKKAVKSSVYSARLAILTDKTPTTMESVLHDINERDRQDMNRAIAPLRQAEDAVLLATSALTLDESIEAVLRIIREKTEENK